MAAVCLPAHAADAPDSKDSKQQQPQVPTKQPTNIEEEYYVPIRSVLGESPKLPLSNGKIMNQLGEFEIVNEGRGDATGDLKYSTPSFTASFLATVNAVSGTTAEGDALIADGPYGMWSLDAEQRFFWMPTDENNKARVTIEGRADFPKSVTIRGKWGGASPAVATLGRIGTRGAMPRSFPIDIKAPEVCSYTWTSPDSGCNNVFTGKFTSTVPFAIKTNIGGFAYASLYQDSLPFNKYAEVTCVIDPESAKVEPCPAARKAEEGAREGQMQGDV